MNDQYPIRVLSFGAGVQSTTLLRMALAEEIEPVQHVIFADTGWEPATVYEHMREMQKLTESHGVEFHIVSGGNIRDDAMDAGSSWYASMPVHVVGRDGNGDVLARRQCTAAYKIDPLYKKMRELAGLKPGQRCTEHRITTLIGISLDEIQRMKNPKFAWVKHEWPLIDKRMTRHDCLVYHHRNALQRPPRSACIGCPYHSNAEWRSIRQNSTEWADAVDFDRKLRSPELAEFHYQGRAYLHPQRVPLDEADISSEEDRGQLSMFGNECEGMCGL